MTSSGNGPILRLANATLPRVVLETAEGLPDRRDGLVGANIDIAGGHIAGISAPGHEPEEHSLDLDAGMVWPCFVDIHTHIDKGHIAPRQPNPDGSFAGALEAVETDRARWTAEDVATRMEFSLRCAHVHGTSLLRTHIDSHPPQHRLSWPVVSAMRDRWQGHVDLQAVSLFPVDLVRDGDYLTEIADLVANHGGILGCFVYMLPDLDGLLDAIMEAAIARELDLDLHVDETLDPNAQALARIAEAALRNRFPGRINCGHCCSLATQPEPGTGQTMERVAEAGISVVSLPLCNLYLMDRQPGRTPRARGITLLHELRAAGVQVAVASDNTRDPFYAYGDLDMLEVFREAVRIGHLDHPVDDWAAAVTRAPAAIAGQPDHGTLRVGGPADLVLFRARNWSELLARPQSDRTVLRNGAPLETELPDHRDLDMLMTAKSGESDV